MIAYFDDSLGSPDQLTDLEIPVNSEAVAAAIGLCEQTRDCLTLASKTVAGLYRAAAESGDLQRQAELRQVRTAVWESRAQIEARIIELRSVQRRLLAPSP